MTDARDIAGIRYDNALLLFEEFVQQAARNPDPATLRGLEGRFAERLQIQPSYWSQIKARSRQIGERLARQFEERTGKPWGWLDEPQRGRGRASVAPAAAATPTEQAGPTTDDERFIVSLVLTYYRRHPDRARARLLDLLGEVLAPTGQPAASAASLAAVERAADLWRKSQAGVMPLKRKR